MPEYDKEKYDLPSDQANNATMNKLRAAVLGANDGVVSVSSIVMGVAGAGAATSVIGLAGLAALIAGALSMAVGEYVSVSSQSDLEKAYIEVEKEDLRLDPDGELDELKREYMKLGLSEPTAKVVADELTAKDALQSHLSVHFGIDPDDINNPWQAAFASLGAFTVGGLVPFLTIMLVPGGLRIPMTVLAVLVVLVVIGISSAKVGNAPKLRAVVRVVVGGVIAMAVTYGVGMLFGTTIG
ncbi:MAG: VIT family protein [Candidatus Saccharimonas sp.]